MSDTSDLKRAIFDRHPYCVWCHRPYSSPFEGTLEHIVSVAKGGKREISNLRLACRTCNNRRQTTSVIDYYCSKRASDNRWLRYRTTYNAYRRELNKSLSREQYVVRCLWINWNKKQGKDRFHALRMLGFHRQLWTSMEDEYKRIHRIKRKMKHG